MCCKNFSKSLSFLNICQSSTLKCLLILNDILINSKNKELNTIVFNKITTYCSINYTTQHEKIMLKTTLFCCCLLDCISLLAYSTFNFSLRNCIECYCCCFMWFSLLNEQHQQQQSTSCKKARRTVSFKSQRIKKQHTSKRKEM